MCDISPGVCAVHISERLIRPPGVKRENALFCFLLACVPWSDIGQIDGQHVGNQDFRGMTAALSIGLVLVGEMLAEGSLGARAIFCSAARADLARSVSDNPN